MQEVILDINCARGCFKSCYALLLVNLDEVVTEVTVDAFGVTDATNSFIVFLYRREPIRSSSVVLYF